MPIVHRLGTDDVERRRTIADALDVLHTLPWFTDQSRADIRLQALRLSSGNIVGMVDLELKGPLPETICIVSLPTSSRFLATEQCGAQRRDHDIFSLDGATVDGAGNVILGDGTSFQSVEIIPARLPMVPSDADWRIVRYVIALIGKEDHCYRSLREGFPVEQQSMIPDMRCLDCSRLCGLAVPPLKVIAAYILPITMKPFGHRTKRLLMRFAILVCGFPFRDRVVFAAKFTPQYDWDRDC